MIRLEYILIVFIVGFCSNSICKSDELSLGDDEGIFLFSDSTSKQTLRLGIWPGGIAVVKISSDPDDIRYHRFDTGDETFAQLVAAVEKFGLFDVEPELLEYGVPGAPHSRIVIRSGDKEVKMGSCIDAFEQRDQLAATSSGIVLREGRSILDILDGEEKDFLLKRLIWTQVELLLHKKLLTIAPTVISGNLVERSGAYRFSFVVQNDN